MFTSIFFAVFGYVFNKELKLSKIWGVLVGLVFGISLSATITLFAPKEIYVGKAEYLLSVIKVYPKMGGNFFTGIESKLQYSYYTFTEQKSIARKEIAEDGYVYFIPYTESAPFIVKTRVRVRGLWALFSLPFNEPFAVSIYLPQQYIPQ
jgi:hypothetical protein